MKTFKSTSRMPRRCIPALFPALLLTACMVGPDYEKPDVPIPNDFRDRIAERDAQSFADLPWWNVFNDKALQALITQALANNHDLEVTVARIEQARALVGVAKSEALPQIGYQASGGGEKSFSVQQNTVGVATFGAFEGLLNASWELDIWGRIRHATDAARANLLAQEDVRRGVLLTLVSDVAADYFRLLELDQELAIAQDSSRTYKKTLDLFSARFQAGKDSKLPVERAQASYQSSLADVQDLTRRIGQQENAISTLVGAYPESIARGHKLGEQTTPQTPLGTTTALLQRRPDILGAEQNMIGANAQIGEAVAEFFPKIGLSAFFGAQGVNIADSWHTFSVWSAALSAAGPIYTGGRLEEVYHERQAYWDETVAQYKQTVVVAFQETSDALIAQKTLALRRTAQEEQVRALQSSADLALLRYGAGRASYFEVLEAEQLLFPAQDFLAQTERDQLLAVVNLYKALGGGWNPEAPGQAGPVASNAAAQVAAQAPAQAPAGAKDR